MQTLLIRSHKQIIVFLIASIVFWCGATVASAEVIRSFSAVISPDVNGSFVVTETIDYDFENEYRRGIFRVIENKHAQSASSFYKDRMIAIELLEVKRDGNAERYLVESTANPFQVRIGDSSVTMTGLHTYTIRYRVTGGLSYYTDPTLTELCWNVTGTEWPVLIEYADVIVRNQNGMLADTRACYKGSPGSTVACDGIEASTDATVFMAANLYPGSGLTIAQELDASRVEKVVLEETNYWIFAIGGGMVWLFALLIAAYRYKTKYKVYRAEMVQYEPYADFKPMFTGVLFDGRLDPHDITAGIVYLAEQGFIKIKKTEEKVVWLFTTSDYEVTVERHPAELTSSFLKELMEVLFNSSEPPLNRSVRLSTLKHSTARQRQNYLTIQRLKSAIMGDLTKKGYFEKWTSAQLKQFTLWCVAGVALALLLFWYILPFAFLLLFMVATLLGVAVGIYRRRTTKGYEALWHLRGFKGFLSKTEQERYAFHNPPDKSPELFMEYLPYAIAFKVEKEWAKVFEGITIPDPSWYDGGTAGHFSAAAFTSDLGSFSSSFASSSGSSGSSGGGSSGGGSGGGGGGSW